LDLASADNPVHFRQGGRWATGAHLRPCLVDVPTASVAHLKFNLGVREGLYVRGQQIALNLGVVGGSISAQVIANSSRPSDVSDPLPLAA
jgi:hypothetical protein